MIDGNLALRFPYIENYNLSRTKWALVDTLDRPDR